MMANVREFASHNQPSCKTFKETPNDAVIVLNLYRDSRSNYL